MLSHGKHTFCRDTDGKSDTMLPKQDRSLVMWLADGQQSPDQQSQPSRLMESFRVSSRFGSVQDSREAA